MSNFWLIVYKFFYRVINNAVADTINWETILFRVQLKDKLCLIADTTFSMSNGTNGENTHPCMNGYFIEMMYV